MARPRNHAKHLTRAVDGMVGAMQGLLKTLGAVPIGGVELPLELRPQRGPGKGNKKLKAALKASWANYTPAQRAARIAAMRAGHARRKREGRMRRSAL